MKYTIVAILFFVLGMGVSWLLADPPTQSVTEAEALPSRAAPAPKQKPQTAINSKVFKPALPASADWRDRTPQAVLAMLDQMQSYAEHLEAENKSLKTQLKWSKEAQKQQEGEAIPWKEDAAPRLHKEALTQALEKALEESGLSGSITDVDCSEYPCTLAGTMENASGPEVFRQLMDTAAMKAYGRDQKLTMMSSRRSTGDNGEEIINHIFGLSLYHSDDPQDSDGIKKRAGYRLNALMEAMEP